MARPIWAHFCRLSFIAWGGKILMLKFTQWCLVAMTISGCNSAQSSEWKYNESVDQMTGKSIASVEAIQRNTTGAVAHITADCNPEGEILFAALLVDEQGNAIKVSNMARNEKGNWRVELARYRMNDKTGRTMLAALEFTNKFQVLAVFGKARWVEFKNSPVMLQIVMSGLFQVVPINYFKDVEIVKAEFKTANGDLIVSIDTSDAAIQRLYAACFKE